MKTNWNFLRRFLNHENPEESPVPTVPNQEMRIVPQWVFLKFEKETHTAYITKIVPLGIDACMAESKTERVVAPSRTKQDHVELAITPAHNLWIRPLVPEFWAHPRKKYADGLFCMEEQYDWVIIQQSAEKPGRVGLAVISYGTQEARIEFFTCAVVGNRFNDPILAKAVNPVLAEIIQRASQNETEARQPEVTAQIDQHVDGLIAQLGRK